MNVRTAFSSRRSRMFQEETESFIHLIRSALMPSYEPNDCVPVAITAQSRVANSLARWQPTKLEAPVIMTDLALIVLVMVLTRAGFIRGPATTKIRALHTLTDFEQMLVLIQKITPNRRVGTIGIILGNK